MKYILLELEAIKELKDDKKFMALFATR